MAHHKTAPKILTLSLIALIASCGLTPSNAEETATVSTEQQITQAIDSNTAQGEVLPDTNRFVVTYKSDKDAAQSDTIAEEELVQDDSVPVDSVEVVKDVVGGVESASVIEVDTILDPAEQEAVIQKLEENPEVEIVEPDLIVSAGIAAANNYRASSEPQAAYQWGLARVNAAGAWAQGYTGAGKVIGTVDTGHKNNHDINGNTIPGADLVSDNYISMDGGGRDADPYDTAWGSLNHGQFVAGIMVSQRNNWGMMGVAPDAKTFHARALGRGSNGYQSDIFDAMAYSAGIPVSGVATRSQPANVINASLGWQGSCPAFGQRIINQIIAKNIPIVAAAGNNAMLASNFTPANCANVFSIGATTSWSSLASFSNYGSGVDIVAPGSQILSTSDSGHTYMGGTSFATPHVSATIAMMQEAYPDITIAQIYNILRSTPNRVAGYPMLNADDAVRKAAALKPRMQSPSFTVVHGMASYYYANGGAGKFGAPTQNEFASTLGGAVQNFSNGWGFYWTPQAGTHAIKWGTGIGNFYANNRWELGWMGYPLTDEEARPGGAVQSFFRSDNGGLTHVYWSPSTGAQPVNGNGAIYWKWANAGAYRNWGYPSTGEIGTAHGGAVQYFRNGSWENAIYWHPTHARNGAVLNNKGALIAAWKRDGGVNTNGYPIHDERLESDGKVHARFSSGAHYTWTEREGVKRVR